MTLYFNEQERSALAGPDIAPQFFIKLDLPASEGGTRYLTDAAGDITIDGVTWQGLSSPLYGRLVSIGELPFPKFGDNQFFDAQLTGANLEFLQQVRQNARNWEGSPASVRFCLFDKETRRPITRLIELFPRGHLAKMNIERSGVGRCVVSMTVEGDYTTLAYQRGKALSAASLNREYSDDKFLDFLGVEREVVRQ